MAKEKTQVGKTQLTVRLADELHMEFKVACARRRVDMSDAVESLVADWVKSPYYLPAPEANVDQTNQYQKKLQAIFDSGVESLINVVVGNIDVMFSYISQPKKKQQYK